MTCVPDSLVDFHTGSKASKSSKKPVKKRTVAKKRVASNPLFADLDEYEIGRYMQIKRRGRPRPLLNNDA